MTRAGSIAGRSAAKQGSPGPYGEGSQAGSSPKPALVDKIRSLRVDIERTMRELESEDTAQDPEELELARLAREAARRDPDNDPAREQLAEHERQLAARRRTTRDVAIELGAANAIDRAVAGADILAAQIAGGDIAGEIFG